MMTDGQLSNDWRWGRDMGREFNSFGKSSVVLYGKHINIVVWIVSVESGHVVTSFDPASSLA